MGIRDAILIEATEDYVGLWSVLWEFREVEGVNGIDERRRKTLALINELLDMGLLQPGSFTDEGYFEAWNLSSTDAMNRIVSEWNQLGREPDLGDIVWFIATEKGERVVSSLK